MTQLEERFELLKRFSLRIPKIAMNAIDLNGGKADKASVAYMAGYETGMKDAVNILENGELLRKPTDDPN